MTNIPRRRISVPEEEPVIPEKIKKRNVSAKQLANLTAAGRGRRPGTPNKISRQLKLVVLGAGEKLGDLSAPGKLRGTGGLEGYCMHLGRKHPATYATLLRSFIPSEMKDSGDKHEQWVLQLNNIEVLMQYTPDQLDAMAAHLSGRMIEHKATKGDAKAYAESLED